VTFSVKQWKADHNLTPFEFEDIEGNKWELPNLQLMTADEAEKALATIELDPKTGLSQLAGSPEATEAILKTPIGALMPLAQAWMEHSTGNSGESAASSSSSTSTARPSKRTSPATTKARTRKR
jgi:hypothetical protein